AEPHAVFAAGIEHAGHERIFANHAQVIVLRQLVAQLRPVFAVVLGLPQIGPVVVEAVGIDDEGGGAGVEPRRRDASDGSPFRQIGYVLGDVGPSFAGVLRDVDQPVVAAGPQDAGLLRRFGQGKDRAIEFGSRVVAGDRSAGELLLARVVARQVGADFLPGAAGIFGFEHDIAAVVEGFGIVGRNQNRRGPLKSIALLDGSLAGRIRRVDGDAARLARAVIVARQDAAVFSGVDDARVGRVGDAESGFAAADGVP